MVGPLPYEDERRRMPMWMCPACGDTWRGEQQRTCPHDGTLMEIAWQPDDPSEVT